MNDITISTPTVDSVIHCGEGSFARYAPQISGNKFIVTDSNVYKLYEELIKQYFGETPVYVLPAGEKSKNQANLFKIFDKMIECGVTRKSTVIAIGGGVVGDVTGLAASLFMRGVKVVQIPTTLLAQVDSSVGGKTAIDYKGVKNILGAFYQPAEVIVDPLFLSTLPKRELRCGLGEIVKYAALNADIYHTLLSNKGNLFDLKFLEGVTESCIRHKAVVVTADEKDVSGARKTLNLGHTTGHAFELFYKRKSHGEFVLIGTYYELYIAQRLGVCNTDYADSLRLLISAVIGKVPAYGDADKAAQGAVFDKKNETRANVSMIVPADIGKCEEIMLPLATYVQYVSDCAAAMEEGI